MRKLAPLTFLLFLALLAGCGSDSESDSTAAPTAADTTAAPDTVGTGTGTTGASTDGASATGNGEGGVELTSIGEFDAPTYLTQPPGGGDLYVVEQGGQVLVVDAEGKTLPTPFLDVSDKITSGGEQGLLSLAFAPDYAQSGLFYVDYTDTNGDTNVVEYKRSADNPLVADTSTARVVLTQDQPFENHNGGQVVFGPDKKLYIGFGDGGSAGDPQRNAQNLDTFLGKILRIDPAQSGGKPYSVPSDNPFVGEPGAKPEVYDYGLRNPWRFSFDTDNGDLWIGDVGQDEQEEIDQLPARRAAGQNLGWSAFEGTNPYNDDQDKDGESFWFPTMILLHDDGNCSVTGGYVVRDPALTSLYGRYLYGDFCAGDLRSFIPAPKAETGADDKHLGLNVPALSSFGQDAGGHIYALSIEGDIYRLDPK